MKGCKKNLALCVQINGLCWDQWWRRMDWLQYNSLLTTPKHSLLTLTAHAEVSTALTAPKAGTVLRLNGTYPVHCFCNSIGICRIKTSPQSCQGFTNQFLTYCQGLLQSQCEATLVQHDILFHLTVLEFHIVLEERVRQRHEISQGQCAAEKGYIWDGQSVNSSARPDT